MIFRILCVWFALSLLCAPVLARMFSGRRDHQ